MLNYISYSNEIVLFWNKCVNATAYDIYLDNTKVGESTDTFFRVKNLNPNQKYNVLIKKILKDEKIEVLFHSICETKNIKKDILVTLPPYNAIGDGKTLNTLALQKAIDDCDKDHRVVIPKGVFLTGGINLHSDVELYIEKEGIIQGSSLKDDYLPLIKSRFEGWECDCYSSLINIGSLDHSKGQTTSNIIIRGEGKINGGGEELLFDIIGIKGDSEIKAQKLLDYQENLDNDKEKRYRLRGRLINISNAEKVIIDGLELSNSPAWNVHIVYSKDIITCGCKIISKGIWNGDGWNPDSSKNCTIFDCEFDTGDDCIAIKSGKNPEGNVINIPSQNINIFSCHALKGRSHGIAIGSEVSGGIDGVNIWDSDFSASFFGLHIKTTKKRGGYIKNVCVSKTKISRVIIREVGYNDDGFDSKSLTDISNLNFNDIEIEYKSGDPNFSKETDSYIYISGFDIDQNKVNDINFNNIKFEHREDMKEYSVKNCSKVSVDGKRLL